MSMTLTVPDRTELYGLYEWLRHDPGLALSATVTLDSSPGTSGEQGALDIIDILLRDGAAIGGLAVSIAMWQLSRAKKTIVTIRRGGDEVIVDGADAETVAKAIRALPSERASPERDDAADPDHGH